MQLKYALVAGAASIATAPCIARDIEPPSAAHTPSPAEADAEVRRLQAELRNAERAASNARDIEAARDEAARANARLEAMQGRVDNRLEPLSDATRAQAREELRRELVEQKDREFGGVELGAGVSYTIARGPRRVTSAQLVNGIVRVSDEDNGRARLLLEGHYFFKPGRFLGVRRTMWGIGPFIALQPGEGDVIEAFAGGLMIGFRRSEETTQSFNLGFGAVFDPNTRLLGEGIVADQPLPAGETEIRYRERSQMGWLLMASFGF